MLQCGSHGKMEGRPKERFSCTPRNRMLTRAEQSIHRWFCFWKNKQKHQLDFPHQKRIAKSKRKFNSIFQGKIFPVRNNPVGMRIHFYVIEQIKISRLSLENCVCFNFGSYDCTLFSSTW